MSNKLDIRNDHYVSQMLLRKFCNQNGKLMRYDVKYGVWKPKGTKNIFSYNNYNGIISNGVNSRNVDEQFSKMEGYLPSILRVLDEAMKHSVTVEPFIYKMLCGYVTWINMLSPFFKAHSPLILLQELNQQIANGSGDLANYYFASPPKMIQCLQKGISKGMKIIYDAPNSLNVVHRVQVNREWEKFARSLVLVGKLELWKMPININLPMSDSAMLPAPINEDDLTYFLPVSPQYVLVVKLPKPSLNTPLSHPVIERKEMPLVAANELVDWICFTANKTLISRVEIPDIKQRIDRTAPQHPNFRRLTSPDSVLAAGLQDFKDFRLRLVSTEKYNAFLDAVG